VSLTLNANEARKADNFSSVIRESGKYVGTITRAEKLLSRNDVEGVGLSFKTDDGASASYLDLYTVKPNNEKLRGYNIVQALLCCARLRTVEEGTITFERWDSEERRMVQATATGYPSLMGKRIGLILQKELQTNQNTGADVERLNIVTVFAATTGLVASEILDNKTKAERIDVITKMIMSNPVRDTRKRAPPKAAPATTAGTYGTPGQSTDFDDDIPF
jgi:hypothetical protein